jgi:phospho-N-acetylmuramoyl-pentapeptide-transferase
MSNIIKILLPAIVSFIFGIFLAPVLTHYFYKYRLWKKKSRSENVSGSNGFNDIHDSKAEISTPRVGGMVIWLAVSFCVFLFMVMDSYYNNSFTNKIYFISRGQTLIPFFALIVGSLVGLGDDFLQIFAKGKWSYDPVILRYIKAFLIVGISLLIGLWFYFKLGITDVYVPIYGFLDLGYLFIPFFIMVTLAVFSSSVIDGIDGLSGGVLAAVFGGYTFVSFLNGQIDLAALCAVITGGILAFLWFNIPPARFYMGETGMIGLTITLSVIAFLTDTVFILPVIAFPLFATSVSVVLQMLSRKFRSGKKIFKLAPLHHHFEYIGWSKPKIVMRYWVVSVFMSIMGVIASFIF